jgi:flagellar protein FliO/FliZ
MRLAVTPRNASGWASFACLLLSSYSSMAWSAANTQPSPVAATSLMSLLQVLFGLGLVLAAIAGTAWLLRKLSPGQVAASGALRVVGGVAVGPKERIVLVDIGETRLVLGVAPGHISTLHEMPRPVEEPASAAFESPAGPFYARLKEMLEKRGGK